MCSSWATIADVCGPCAAYDFPMDVLETQLHVASEILYNLTFQQWRGECVDVVRPCATWSGRLAVGRWQSWSGQQIAASGAAGQWGLCGCNVDTSCGCSSLSVIALPRRPVTGISKVMIDGLVLDPAFYRVDDWFRLTYLPGVGDTRRGWPCCQRLDLPTTEDQTFEVTYPYGSFPPLGGVDAAATFGCELALSRTGNSACRLPKRLQTITRQGVTMSFIDDLSMMTNGWTGLAEVDSWIASIRFARKNRTAAVYNPDHHARVRRTGV